MSTVISVENVSKSYRLGTIGGGTLKEDFARWWAKTRGKPDPLAKVGEEHSARRTGEQFWALRDISFQVRQGEVLGIIGRNGAGKSTLLKILSQVTSPSSGEIKIKGRIASLLEVGTGFHPELTGRENVFLNGAILGMTRKEIRQKFDEIVAFSGIEEFIDTPVKRYSSGMYVRLAFAVAAHLESEILILDEVLAVGDAAFQAKCLGKMGEVSRTGRTVLFVSHNFEAVKTLCDTCVLLDSGCITHVGDPVACIEEALSELTVQKDRSTYQVNLIRNRPGLAMPTRCEIRPSGKRPEEPITFDDAIVASIGLSGALDYDQQTLSFVVLTPSGTHIFNSFYSDAGDPNSLGETDRFSVTIPSHLLPGGLYEAAFGCTTRNGDLLWTTRGTWFHVQEVQSFRSSGLTMQRTGLISIVLAWKAQ